MILTTNRICWTDDVPAHSAFGWNMGGFSFHLTRGKSGTVGREFTRVGLEGGSGRQLECVPQLAETLTGWRKDSPTIEKKMLVEADVPELLTEQAHRQDAL